MKPHPASSSALIEVMKSTAIPIHVGAAKLLLLEHAYACVPETIAEEPIDIACVETSTKSNLGLMSNSEWRLAQWAG